MLLSFFFFVFFPKLKHPVVTLCSNSQYTVIPVTASTLSNELIMVVCETTVKLKKGDITAESTDAIINLNNAKLDRNAGVSKAILNAAGSKVQEECKVLAKKLNDGCVVTSPGNLKCSKIIHLIDVKPDNIVASVKKALKAADENNMATVSLPAMAIGVEQLTAKNSIKWIIKGIEDYLTDPSVMTVISDIIIVAFKQDVYEKYQCLFKNCEKNYPHFSAFGKLIELVKGDITEHAMDCIVNLTFPSLNRSSGVSGAILKAAGDTVTEECKKIGRISSDGVAITSGGKLESKHIMHIIGPIIVPDYEPAIDRILSECHKNGFKSLSLPAIGTGIAGVDVEESIKAILNSILKYLTDTLIPSLETITIIVFQDEIYEKYLKVFKAKSTELQALQREERIVSATLKGATFIYPVTWTEIRSSEYQEIRLMETSEEYKDVKEKFFKTTSARIYEITEIKRIQNVAMWKSFTINKQNVNEKNPGPKNIRHLYHGTHANAIGNINRDGFNRVYCGKNATLYGNGTYFAVESSYSSNDTYSPPDSNGKKYIYQAAVITGRYCEGKYEYKEAPHINGDPSKGRYDSVVDNVGAPKMFVVFHDDVAYPEYLITFKKSS
ncbi:protein mono-ADP-ribosyltransferase PARP15-like isoform X2 [Dendropsophus ebraccatus]|uniref:protein mono-ADP-ribosyltransferase PARP15-like isoform X2 n=1 Tax=Dendropsophus ebraccatus TaxID=150705 RepID=UPI0038314F6A